MTKENLLEKVRSHILNEITHRHSLERSFNWEAIARPNQKLPKGDWKIWLILAGRGFGKTRAGAEAVRSWATSGFYRRLALVGQTQRDVEQVMIEGESGLLHIHPESERPVYNRSRGSLVWPSGAIATIYSGERFEKLRGPQFDGAWVDELAKYRMPEKLWEQLMFSLRLGNDPRLVVTTTPRPLNLIKRMVKGDEGKVVVTRGSTFDNKDNLSNSFLTHMKHQYATSPLGRQELDGVILEEEEGALWRWDQIEACQVKKTPDLDRLIIAVDPAVTSHQNSDETGIIVAGESGNKAYILEDLSGRYAPNEWCQLILEAYHNHKADKIIAEVNQGGDLVEQMLRSMDSKVSFKAVRATRGKKIRAEPVAHLYEQGLIHHVGDLSLLEEQLCSYSMHNRGQKSPDRMDALVWALTELMLTSKKTRKAWMTS